MNGKTMSPAWWAMQARKEDAEQLRLQLYKELLAAHESQFARHGHAEEPAYVISYGVTA